MNINNIKFINIFSATVIVELIILIFFRFTKSFFSVKAINDWYDKLKWSAVILDLLIFIIGFYLTIFVNKYYKLNNYIYFLLIQLVIQIIHDILFYRFIILKSEPGNSIVMDEFKYYAKNTNLGAIVGDSWMYLMGIPLLIKTLKYDNEYLIFISTICLYLIGYLIYQKPLYFYESYNLEYLIPFFLNLKILTK